MLPLIENGHIYIGQPPLFRLGKGKKEKYFLDENQLNNYLFTQASKNYIIYTDKNEKIKNDFLVYLLERFSVYQKIIDYMNRMNIWEDMLYYLLDNNIRSADQFKDESFVNTLRNNLVSRDFIAGDIRSTQWKENCFEFDAAIRDKLQIMVTIGPHIPLIAEYRTALNFFNEIKPYLTTSFKIYAVEKDAESSLKAEVTNWRSMLMTIREESFKGSNLQRYKGLGEMNPEQLWTTTMNPEHRTLLQVKINDAEKADDIFTTLMGDKVEPRREFIQDHALEVTDLDI